MATACCKNGQYNWAMIGHILTFIRRGRSKIYTARCSSCNRYHEFTEPQMRKAMKENPHG